MDTGIIKSLKDRYKKADMRLRLKARKDSMPFVYSLYDAVVTMSQLWKKFPTRILRNCWRHAKLFVMEPEPSNDAQPEILPVDSDDEIVDAIELYKSSKETAATDVELKEWDDMENGAIVHQSESDGVIQTEQV